MNDKTNDVLIPHTGSYNYHDDDCWCAMGGLYCNRDGHVWSCCGACKENSDCTGDVMHPTYWKHSLVSKTRSGEFKNNCPLYISNQLIRERFPDMFNQK